jgi:hypothetical protein
MDINRWGKPLHRGSEKFVSDIVAVAMTFGTSR